MLALCQSELPTLLKWFDFGSFIFPSSTETFDFYIPIYVQSHSHFSIHAIIM